MEREGCIEGEERRNDEGEVRGWRRRKSRMGGG